MLKCLGTIFFEEVAATATSKKRKAEENANQPRKKKYTIGLRISKPVQVSENATATNGTENPSRKLVLVGTEEVLFTMNKRMWSPKIQKRMLMWSQAVPKSMFLRSKMLPKKLNHLNQGLSQKKLLPTLLLHLSSQVLV